MARGFIYVLVNSSIPGLVKIGKTTRDPTERAKELSAATGVATPFVVVFQHYFNDCDLAERYIHAILQRKGLRKSDNREFFQATPNDVIHLILQIPDISHDNTAENNEELLLLDNDEQALLTQEDLSPQIEFGNSKAQKPWLELLSEADMHYYGFGDCITDEEEALKIYKQAASMGSILAYEYIGKIYLNNNGIRRDENKALFFFKEGAQRGNYYCFSEMSNLFFYKTEIENFFKAMKNFLINRTIRINADIEDFNEKHLYAIWGYIRHCIILNVDILYVDLIKEYRNELIDFSKKVAAENSKPVNFDKKIILWLEFNIFGGRKNVVTKALQWLGLAE